MEVRRAGAHWAPLGIGTCPGNAGLWGPAREPALVRPGPPAQDARAGRTPRQVAAWVSMETRAQETLPPSAAFPGNAGRHWPVREPAPGLWDRRAAGVQKGGPENAPAWVSMETRVRRRDARASRRRPRELRARVPAGTRLCSPENEVPARPRLFSKP